MEKQVDIYNCFPIYGWEKGTLISKEKGTITIPIEIRLPEVYTLDANDYESLNKLFFDIINIVGENVLIHKQDFFLQENYQVFKEKMNGDFMERANELHFKDRPYLRLKSYLYISLVPKNYLKITAMRVNSFLKKTKQLFDTKIIPDEFLNKEVILEFNSKIDSVVKLINESNLITAKKLNYDSVFTDNGLYSSFFNMSFKEASMKDISFEDNRISLGDKYLQFFTLENLDQFEKDSISSYEYYGKFTTDTNKYPVGNLFSLGFKLEHEHIINQYIYIPESKKILDALKKKAKRFRQFSKDEADDNNSIYADQITSFNADIIDGHKSVVMYHMNVLGISDTIDDYRDMKNSIKSAFNKLRIKVNENSIDRKNLFFGSVPGNSIGISSDLYMPMSSDMASSLVYYEGEYKDSTSSVNGMKLVDRISGKPISVDMYREKEEKGLIFNRGTIISSGSGGGKSFFVNHYLSSEFRIGSEAIIMEAGNSYDKTVEVFGGVILEHDDKNPFTFNPFSLDQYDIIDKDDDTIHITEGKLLFLTTLINLIIGISSDSKSNSIEENQKREINNSIIQNMISLFYKNNKENHSFDSFYKYVSENLEGYMEEKKISKENFDVNAFLFLLESYQTGNVRGNLLNKTDERISNLTKEKIIYFKLRGLIDNDLLFPIIALMIMDIFTKKLTDSSKRSINKICALDEAWKALNKPELEEYFNFLTRAARKDGGQPIFISQKPDDFIASEVIKNAIIVNSDIKIFLDMNDYNRNFETIQELMGLTNKQKQNILSLNKDHPPDRKLRDVAICWKEISKTYGIETSLNEACIYETNPVKNKKIFELFDKNFKDWNLTAQEYSNK